MRQIYNQVPFAFNLPTPYLISIFCYIIDLKDLFLNYHLFSMVIRITIQGKSQTNGET